MRPFEENTKNSSKIERKEPGTGAHYRKIRLEIVTNKRKKKTGTCDHLKKNTENNNQTRERKAELMAITGKYRPEIVTSTRENDWNW